MIPVSEYFYIEQSMVHVTARGLELLFGAGYEDNDIEELFLEGGEVVYSPILQPHSQGLRVIVETENHERLQRCLQAAMRQAKTVYAGGFAELVP